MPLVQLQGKIENIREIRRMLGSRTVTQIKKIALQDTASFWHKRILPRHFQPAAHFRYRHEQRSRFYRETTKQEEGVGKGKSVDDVFSGQSERWMKVFKNITGTSHRATLTMRPPRYFTQPKMGDITLPDGRVISITHQPDKPGEILTRHPQDDQSMSDYLRRDLQLLVDYYMDARASG